MLETIDLLFLSELEEIEYKSIQWGYIDGALLEDDAYDYALKIIEDNEYLANEFMAKHHFKNIDDEILIDYLLEEKLLFEVQITPSKNGFRTRFGESIRLLANLRQIFPNRGWEEAPKLVSDFRVKLQKRFYPIRDVAPLDLLHIEPFKSLSRLQQDIWKKLVTVYPNMKLANFQKKATSTLLQHNSPYKGVIVTAGTGSGKTLSFYLPALLKVVDSIKMDSSHWTRVLAAYPRIELLRDQLSEAILQSLEIENVLKINNLRPMRIGALYGAIPDECSYASIEQKKWKRNREDTGWICPIINCPRTDTPLIWLDSDIDRKIERLVPSQNIEGAITLESKHIALTRESLLRETPDLLFITLEMLNQRLSDFKINKLFGINQYNKKPFLMLLDEVHTYTGTTGAQAALVIGRWKQALWNPDLKFVGLSATLSEAERFFSELTGLYEDKILEITPQKEEMIEEGAEYQIVLKGDPVNRTGLLSTTIQTIMLMGRIVEPMSKKSKLYGQKIFAFTDDLDVTNRLFDDLKDAEGWDVFNRNSPEDASLARLRHKDINKYARYRDGQDWRACEDIGHILDQNSVDAKLKITRTSSQDTGVDMNSSVVVATASLEVGFNDPTVGVVVQHKAPHNWANFLQRKGRAGRKRGMRPFMITTLSDFGRDKVAFQHYEHFFEPRVPAQRLPISNRYILKIQGTITLFDWLAKKLPHRKIWIFKLLSHPTKNSYELDTLNEIKVILNQVLLVDSEQHSEFINYLKYSLSMTEENTKEVLWSAPRSLLLEVMPTLLRRIESNWKLAFPKGEEVYENYQKNHPLPEFITATLFSDLALPEVQVIASLDQDREKTHSMALIQAMREFAPGRISRRFATDRGNLYHWIPIATDTEEQNLEISDYSIKVDRVKNIMHNNQDIEIFRPWEYKLEKNSDPRISKRSNSILEWNAKFKIEGAPVKIHLVKGNHWSQTIKNLDFYVNTHNSSVEVTRYSTMAIANFSFTDGTALETKVHFTNGESPAAIGFSMHVDGLHLKYKVPSLQKLQDRKFSDEFKRELKVAWYRHLVIENRDLPSDINYFERHWLQEVILNAIVIVSEEKNINLDKANDLLNNDSSIIFEVLSVLFNTDIRLIEEDSDEESTNESRLYERLKELLDTKETRVQLHSIFHDAISIEDDNWWRWIRNSLHHSFAETLLSACQQLTPNQSAIDTLLVDPLPISEQATEADIWLTESSAGGVGVLDSLVTVISSNPTLLFQAIDASTQLSDYEHVVDSLEYFIDLVNTNEEINALSLKVCVTREHKARQEALSSLYLKLSKYGISMSHAFKVALNTRLLKDGVDNNFFSFIYEIIKWRDDLEDNKQIAVDLRLLCFLISKQESFKDKINQLQIAQSNQVANVVNFLTNILWSRNFEARWQVLQSYSPFKQNIFTDPKLVKHYILEEKIKYVDMVEEDWNTQTLQLLAKYGVCKLKSTTKNEEELRAHLVKLLTKAVDVDFLQLFIVIVGIEKDRTGTTVSLKLREEW